MGKPLVTIAELRAIEDAAQRELPAGELMARAGRAAARWIDTRAGDRQRNVLVVAGPGNNGGDGFVTASELRQRGHQVECVLLGAAAPTTADARAAFDRWCGSGGSVHTALPRQCPADLVVDALFGIGLARPISAVFAEAVRWINGHAAEVVALDVPSGLDADRGSWVGAVPGVRANATVTFIADKPGLRTGDGVDASGEITVESLGVAVQATTGCLLSDADDFAPVLQLRGRNTHKGTYGDTLIVGGGRGMVGAPLLAARAALRSGAGRVYVDCIGAPELSVDPLQPELMFRRHSTLSRLGSIVVGCGLGLDDQARAALAWSLASEAALVIDADGLNLLAQATAPSAVAARRAVTVLTPHPLEAARLLRSDAAAVQADRLGAARALAREHDCLVVLKGAGTVVAQADGRCAINPTGGPALATAGTGDVLSGLLGGFLAQGHDAWSAALAAVWLHGAAAEGSGDRGLVASDIAPRAMQALRTLQFERQQRR
jgi:ADP-dependent NAD(P)H-hydrate dehydratase / NAD(P)H-hydrate epimerase